MHGKTCQVSDVIGIEDLGDVIALAKYILSTWSSRPRTRGFPDHPAGNDHRTRTRLLLIPLLCKKSSRCQVKGRPSRRSGHVINTLPNPPSKRFKQPETAFFPGNAIRESPHEPHTAPKYPCAVTCRLNQLILGHCFTGEYYEIFKTDEDIHCPCRPAPLQTIRYILLNCRLHSEPRMHLRKASRSLN